MHVIMERRGRAMRLLAVAVALAAVIVWLAACGDDDNEADTIEGATPSDTTPTPAQIPDTAEDYAVAVFSAWSTDDTDTLENLASEEVIEVLVARGYDDDDLWEPTGCDGAAGSVYCQWRSEDGETLQLRIDNAAASAGERHAAVEARFS